MRNKHLFNYLISLNRRLILT